MTRNEHPSDRLSSGGVRDFMDALSVVWMQWRCERGQVEHIQAALLHAGRVYREEQEAARLRTVARLREDVHAAEAALDDEAARWLELLASSLEDQDYSRLAI